jgi:hypothetical protein
VSEGGYRPDRRIPLRSVRASAAVIGVLLTGALVALIVESDRFTLHQPTQAEVEAFGAQLEHSLSGGDMEFLRGRMPGDAIAVHALSDRELPSERLQQIATTFSSGLPAYVQRLREQVGARGTFRLIGAHLGPARVLLRMSGQGLGYLELRLAKDSMGRVVCVDLISHLGGTSFRNTLRAERTPAVADAQRKLASFLHQGRDSEGLAYWQRLPAEVQEDGGLALMRLAAAGKVDDPEQLEAAGEALEPHLSRWSQDPYGGPDRRLTLMGLHTHRQEFAQALKLVDLAEDRVGPDAAFDAMRARILLQSGDLEAGAAKAAQAVEALPLDPYVQEIQFAAALLTKNWAAAVEAARVLVKLGAADEDLRRHRGWDAFVESEPYRAWRE